MRALPLLAATLAAAAHAAGLQDQPRLPLQPDLREDLAAIGPDLWIAALRDAYRREPIGEDVRIEVLDHVGRPIRAGRITLRLDAADPPRLRLEMEPYLIVSIDAGRLVAAHARNEAECFTHDLDRPPTPAVLQTILPPIHLPQLELAFGQDERFASPITLLESVHWHSTLVPPTRPGEPPLVNIVGQDLGRTFEATIDPRTERLRGFTAQIGPPGTPDRLSIRATIHPIDPGDPAAWPIRTDRRRQVGSLSQLRLRRGPIPVGEPAPALNFYGPPDLTPWRLTDILPDPPRDGSPDAAVIVMFRAVRDSERAAEIEQTAWKAIDAALSAVRMAEVGQPLRGEPEPRRIAQAVAAVFELADFAQFGDIRFKQIRGRWEARPEPDGPDPNWVWTQDPARSIGWFDPEADVVVVAIDRERVVRFVAAAGPEAEREELARSLAGAFESMFGPGEPGGVAEPGDPEGPESDPAEPEPAEPDPPDGSG